MEPEKQRLRELIRARLSSGALPRFADERIFAGKGDMQRCVCCGDTVTAKDIQYEVVLSDQSVLFMHLECFDAWCKESSLA